jgi:CheY-like chemotaxis protein/HPt (histidine-containing phosphotransfer) domain-containing protein
LHVLTVDDNATNRLILRELLSSWGMTVAEAPLAEPALALLAEAHAAGHPFDLVITDMMMPDLDGFGFIERVRAEGPVRDVPIIMLTSTHRSGDVERAQELGVAAHLAKPIRQAVLMDTVAEVFGRNRRSKHTARTAARSGAPQRSLRILLAEDNALNQRIARLNLEQWGHLVTLAGDGVAAVEHFDSEPFDLILMDSQMPRMSGLEATAAIRQRESAGRRVPIVAMTANVLSGFREECLAAGMDGFVSKPIKREDLVAEMARVIPDLFRAETSLRAATADRPQPAPDLKAALSNALFDRDALLASLGGDAAMLREMLQICLEQDAPRLSTALDDALAKDDAAEIGSAAHAIKGLVGELHAASCRDAAATLEHSAHEGRQAALAGEGAVLRREFARLIDALRSE